METPWLEANVFQEYKNGNVVLLGINLDEPLSTVNSYLTEHSVNYTVLTNGGSVYSEFGNGYVPYNVIIDGPGFVQYTASGFNSSLILSTLNSLSTIIEESDP
mgnify:CR=1 FL=1